MRAVVIALGTWLGVCSLAHAGSGSPPPSSEGTLAARIGDERVPVPLEHTRVHVRVSGHIADVEIEQRFHNPYARKIEATYLFPLPTGAAVHDMAISAGERRIRGELYPVGAARARYQAAVRRGFVAALTSEERPNLFTQTVGNLEPGARVSVHLRYSEPLAYRDGGYQLVFPMVAPPRHVPAGLRLSPAERAAIQPPVLPPGQRPAHELTFTAEIDAGVPVHALSSPSHAIVVDGPRVRLAGGATIPNQDLILRWQVAGDETVFGAVAHRGRGDGAFLLYLQPPRVPPAAAIAPREVIFVLDTSSSMRGLPLARGKALVRGLLGGLRADDSFQIVRFAGDARPLGDALLAASDANRAGALAWLDALEAGGGTDVSAGLAGALDLPHDPARLRLVVFVTDGYVGNEKQVLAEVQAKIGDARLFSFGVGSAVNRYLLEEMALLGRGAVDVVGLAEEPAAAVARFVRRVDAPLVTDVSIDWGGLAVDRLTPARLPDLFAGEPLVLAGRYARPGAADIVVRGWSAGRPVERRVRVVLPEKAERPAVAQAWARRQIAVLERERLRGEGTLVRERILALALAHRLVTAETAFVAVDTTRVTRGGVAEPVPVPVDVPAGVERQPVVSGMAFGTVGYGIGGGGYGAGYGHASGMSITVTHAPKIVVGSAVVMPSRATVAFGAIAGGAEAL